ncbi:2-hydroxy-6-oxononadienedioate/2-hydroxy-6-oxononatrienedioate hydrolase [Rhodococcus sp. B50]|nr:2-hydroxy-6-oxononadienedioate/2-hydroxy-6-oxononatrienedioate hydrolase [Rhodococcus sp. B50]
MVRDAGDEHGFPLVYFHGTPGSRLEVGFGDEIALGTGVRVISFDRPGYGRSAACATDLGLVARDVEAVLDSLEVGNFAAFGWSGGGPFALAAAAVLGERVTRVGISGGPAPAQHVPEAREALTENDLLALSFLPDDPAKAADQFLAGNRQLLDAMMSMKDDETAPWIDWLWGESDPDVVAEPALRQALHVSFREALRQGPMAIAWDNVAFVGPWGFDIHDVSSPVHLWYGSRDMMAPPANGTWLAAELPNAELVLREREGHLLPLQHWEEMLRVVTVDR